ncbi:hypothetical protein D3C78_889490 [compost metagenome]
MRQVIADNVVKDLGIADTRRLHYRYLHHRWFGDGIHHAILIREGTKTAGLGAGLFRQYCVFVSPFTQ